MERFQRQYSATHRTVEVQLLDLVPGGNRWDDSREVRLIMDDERIYSTVFFRDPQSRGGHWWEEPGMVIVQDLNTNDLLTAVEEILGLGAVEEAFELLIEK